ncbi:hypothetical protein BC830DRAFT_1154522 [Chytriomyces sp. MP71]|nr:hypothetical protein BC830DRAFT_1154522 [Chytriomyces sp. MP71]
MSQTNPFLNPSPRENNGSSVSGGTPKPNPFNPFLSTSPGQVGQPRPEAGTNPFNPFKNSNAGLGMIVPPAPVSTPVLSPSLLSEFDPFASTATAVSASSPGITTSSNVFGSGHGGLASTSSLLDLNIPPPPPTAPFFNNSMQNTASIGNSIPVFNQPAKTAQIQHLDAVDLPPPYASPNGRTSTTPPSSSSSSNQVSSTAVSGNHDIDLDERLALQLALGDDNREFLEVQLQADAELARRLSFDDRRETVVRPVSGSVRPVPDVPSGSGSGGGDDAELARILQEEEDEAYARQLVDQEKQAQKRSSFNTQQPSAQPMYYQGAYNHSYTQNFNNGYPGNPPPMSNGFAPGSAIFGYSSGYSNATYDALRVSAPYAHAVGKPGHSNPFPPEPAGGESRYPAGQWRDFDVCFWGNECVTVMEGMECLFYVNLLSNSPGSFGPHAGIKWDNLSFQKKDSSGQAIYVMRESLKGKSFQLFDTSLKKAITCQKTKTNHLSFSTITNSEKLHWQDGEMRVQHGIFEKRSVGDTDLHAYLIREFYDTGLRRTRIRVGGRGLGKVELCLVSFVGLSLLTTV